MIEVLQGVGSWTAVPEAVVPSGMALKPGAAKQRS